MNLNLNTKSEDITHELKQIREEFIKRFSNTNTRGDNSAMLERVETLSTRMVEVETKLAKLYSILIEVRATGNEGLSQAGRRYKSRFLEAMNTRLEKNYPRQ